MTEYRIGRAGEEAKILALANSVFNTDFTQLIPKVYGPGKTFAPMHHLAEENGEIIALASVYDRQYTLGGQRLKVGYVGTVSTHPDHRLKGHMRALMARLDRQMRRDGTHIALLGGIRHRYAHYGYEVGSEKLSFEVLSFSLPTS